jgi:arylsulfatase A-like enzyme
MPDSRPNVVFIILDSFRQDHIRFYNPKRRARRPASMRWPARAWRGITATRGAAHHPGAHVLVDGGSHSGASPLAAAHTRGSLAG